MNQKKTNTRIASPGAQIENSNQQYLKSHTYESRSLSKDREKVEKLETKNFVSPRQIPSWTALGGAISDKLHNKDLKQLERKSSFNSNPQQNFVAPNKTI